MEQFIITLIITETRGKLRKSAIKNEGKSALEIWNVYRFATRWSVKFES